ncbi:hypothetical protein GCM10022409_19080 [Hymenobacter glaciei]|uniref:Uncharacterized protein n=1 Tax=Hymenobacter glaciei TaxID=877209 RepID=A0ABP7U2H1_9BACT
MDDFKIALFEREHSNRFPPYETLTYEGCGRIRTSLASKYGVNSFRLEVELAAMQSVCSEVNGEELKLLHILTSLGVNPMPNVYINWCQFERIDKIAIAALDKFFDDIWFPVSDDIDLFDESLSWVLSIRHDGVVSFMK